MRKFRLFCHRNKNKLIIAGLCSVIVISIIVLCVVFIHHHKDTGDTQPTGGSAFDREIKNGIPGSEIRKELAGLKKDGGYTIVVATERLVLNRKTKETAYVVFPLTSSKQPTYLSRGTTQYMLFGICYGNTLNDDILMNTGDGSYYTIGGQMKKSEYAVRHNYKEGTEKTVITKNMFHVYKEAESLYIPDDELFEKKMIYDADGKEIGCFYY